MKRALVMALAGVFFVSCGRDDGGGGGGSGGGSVGGGGGGGGGGTGGDFSIVPNGAVPPVGLTWHVGLDENVPMSVLVSWYAKMQTLSADLWQASEGQVFLAHVVIKDVATDVSVLDAVVTVGTSSGGGQMLWMSGRQGRHIAVDSGATPFTLRHEASHMIFVLSWTIPDPTMWPGTYLVDEYDDGMQDSECIMESVMALVPPTRWCGPDNHVPQPVQPTSCWQQILTDYPNFAYAGVNSTSAPVPPTTVEYVDAP